MLEPSSLKSRAFGVHDARMNLQESAPISLAEAVALYRTLNGIATAEHDGILMRREGKVCLTLAEKARTERTRFKWHGRYLAATGAPL